jgi:hypothetical protein
MKKSFITALAISSCTAFLLLSGCGDSASAVSDSSEVSGQLVDSYVENADYTCGDGSKGLTDVNGTFKCKALPVAFRLGGLKLGEITSLATDKQVFPQELLGLKRTDLNNSDVRAMARLLQSCDDDNNSGNGLRIQERVKTAFVTQEDFNASNLDAYATDANLTLISDEDALEHLTQTTELIDAVNDATDLPLEIGTAILTPQSDLSQELKNTLSYMGNEERLAFDVYNKLYEKYPLPQLTNIAQKSERVHIETVQLLVQKYISSFADFTNLDLDPLSYKDTAVTAMVPGVYDISVIQELYNVLIEKGMQSEIDALQVGCMVEVTDINDLDGDIALAKESNADDITVAFEFLRDGSYSHYWAFNTGLVNKGVANGCCSMGDFYCKTKEEYPQDARSQH